ncbi:ABC-F family ATP-binding cassette domain-containing protein [Fervidibacillus halotolerans]|uniref:ATP-binding cassette domain-containing protein n=1 Tax=Fervidibacillus halotolerans TaxID=2980027 RepID=A0A9E8S0G5_9BACI|nr:ABC-F family ATP-binding cassette domain-containing protein [Fervidibacillus halotolerans]WAA12572.1 ATP-binding cassette domain-containing protein [Fervidibacillus halotolerans]
MILLQVNQLTKYFGADLILTNIKLEIQDHDRIAIVGRNGAGKSTLLKIIAGQLSYDSGEMIKPKHITIGFLDQHTGLNSEHSIWDELMSVFRHLQQMEKRLRYLEEQMAKESIYTDKAQYNKIVSEYDQLQIQFKEEGGYQYEADIRSVLHGLQFSNYDYDTKISVLSGGQKTRLALGKLLLSKPDILILDEPTNHLDIETLGWLEQYLQNYEGAILIVSHDRYFLDKVVTRVYECSQKTLTHYVGNYSEYLHHRAEKYQRELKQYEKQQEEIARMKDFIARNLARASTTKRAQSRRKALEKMGKLNKPVGNEKSATFSFQIGRQSGNEVLHISNLSIGYESPVATNIQFQITRRESVALLGPNGIGKSTLLKTIAGILPPISGDIRFGTNVTIAYYDQEQANLSSNKRVLDELWDDNPTLTEREIRTILGQFLFSQDDVLKTVSSLSGGEKARLSLAKLMMKKANFLILDEPTNHLDLDSKEVLENALIDYPGTILFVSHDRYFINRLATKVLDLSTTGITEYLGDYDYFLEKREELLQGEVLNASELKSKKHNQLEQEKQDYFQNKELKKKERQRKRRIEEIQKQIEELENHISVLEQELMKEEIYTDYEKAATIHAIITEKKDKIDQLLEEWTELEEHFG